MLRFRFSFDLVLWSDPWGQIEILAANGYSVSDEHAEADSFGSDLRAESAGSDAVINAIVRSTGTDITDPFAVARAGSKAAVREALGERLWDSQQTGLKLENYDRAAEKAQRYFNARIGLGYRADAILEAAEASVPAMTGLVSSDYVKKMVHGYGSMDYDAAFQGTGVNRGLAAAFDGAGQYLADMIANGNGDLFMGVYEFNHEVVLGLLSQRARAGKGRIDVFTDPLAMTVGKVGHVLTQRALGALEGVNVNANLLDSAEGTASWFSENAGDFNARLWMESPAAYLGDPGQFEDDEVAANFYKKWNHEHYKLFTVGMDRLSDLNVAGRAAEARQGMRVLIGSANVTHGAMGGIATRGGAYAKARGSNIENVYTLDASALGSRVDEGFFDYMMRSFYEAQQSIANRSMGSDPLVFNAAERSARGYVSGVFNNNAFVDQVTHLMATAARQSWRGSAEVTVMINRLSDLGPGNAMLALLQNSLGQALAQDHGEKTRTSSENFRINLVLGRAHANETESTRAQAEAILADLTPEQRKMVNIVQNANAGIHSKSFGMRYVDAQGRERSVVTAGSTNLNDSGLLGDYGRGAAFRNLSVIVDSMEDKGAEASFDLMSQFVNLSRYTAASQAGTGGSLGYSASQLEALAVKYGLRRDNASFEAGARNLDHVQFTVGGRVRAGSVGHFELGNLMTLTAAAPTADAVHKGFGFAGQIWVQELNKFVSPTAGIFERGYGDTAPAPLRDEPFSAMETLVAGVAGANRMVEQALVAIETRFGADYLSQMMGSRYLRSRLTHRIRQQVRDTFENFQGYELGTPNYAGKGLGVIGMGMVRAEDGSGILDMTKRVAASPDRMYASAFGGGSAGRTGRLSLPGFKHFFTSGGLSKFRGQGDASAATFYRMEALATLSIGARKEGNEAEDDNLLLMPITKIGQLPQRIQTLLSARNLNPLTQADDAAAFEAIGAGDKGVGYSLLQSEGGRRRSGIKGVGFMGLGMVGDNAYVTAESIEGFFVKNESFRKTFKVSGHVQDPIHLLLKQAQQMSAHAGSGVTQLGDDDRFHFSYEALEKMGHQLDVALLDVDGGLHQIIQTVDTNTQRTPGMGLVLDLRAGDGTTVTKAGRDHSVTLTGYSVRELTSGDRSMVGLKAPLVLIQEQSRLLQDAKASAAGANKNLYKWLGLDNANILFGEGVIKSGEALIETGLHVLQTKGAMNNYMQHFRKQVRANGDAYEAGKNKYGLIRDLRFLMGRMKNMAEDDLTRRSFGAMEEHLANASSLDDVVRMMEMRFSSTRDHLAQGHTVSMQAHADHVGTAALAFGLHALYYLDKTKPETLPRNDRASRGTRSYYGHLAGAWANAADQEMFGLIPIFTTISVNAASQAFSSRDRVRFLNYHAGGYTDAIFDLLATSPAMQQKVEGYRDLLNIGIFGMHGDNALFVDATKQSVLSHFVAGVHEVTASDGSTGSAFGAAVAYEQQSRRAVSRDFGAWGSGDGNSAEVSKQGNAIAKLLESRRQALMLGQAHKDYISDPTNRSYRAEGGVANNAVQDLFTSLEKGGVGSVALMVPEIGRYENNGNGVTFKTDGTLSGGGEAVVVWRQVNLVNPAHAKTTGSFEDFSSDVMRHQAQILKLMKVAQKLDIRDGQLLSNRMSDEEQEEYGRLLESVGSYQEAVRDLVASDLQKFFGGQLSVYGHNAVIGTVPEVGTSEMVLDNHVWADMRREVAKEIVGSLQDSVLARGISGSEAITSHIEDGLRAMYQDSSLLNQPGWLTAKGKLQEIGARQRSIRKRLSVIRAERDASRNFINNLRDIGRGRKFLQSKAADARAELKEAHIPISDLYEERGLIRTHIRNLRAEYNDTRQRRRRSEDNLRVPLKDALENLRQAQGAMRWARDLRRDLKARKDTAREAMHAAQGNVSFLKSWGDTFKVVSSKPNNKLQDARDAAVTDYEASVYEYTHRESDLDALVDFIGHSSAPRTPSFQAAPGTLVPENLRAAEGVWARFVSERRQLNPSSQYRPGSSLHGYLADVRERAQEARRNIRVLRQAIQPMRLRESALHDEIQRLELINQQLTDRIDNQKSAIETGASNKTYRLATKTLSQLGGSDRHAWFAHDRELRSEIQELQGEMQLLKDEAHVWAMSRPEVLQLQGQELVEYLLDTDLEYRRKYVAGIMQRAGAPFGPYGVVAVRDVLTTSEYNARNPSVRLAERKYGRGAYVNIGAMAFNLGDFDGDTGSVSYLQGYAHLKAKEVLGTLSGDDVAKLKKAERMLSMTTEEVSFQFARAYTGLTSVFDDNILYNTAGLSNSEKQARIHHLQDLNEAAVLKFNSVAGPDKLLHGHDINALATNAELAAKHLFGGNDVDAQEWVLHRQRLAYGHSLSQAGNAYVQAMQSSHQAVHEWMAGQRAQGNTQSDSALYAAFWRDSSGAASQATRALLKAAESLTQHDTRFFSGDEAKRLGMEAANEVQGVSTNQLAGFFMATSFASQVVMSRVFEAVHVMDQKVGHRYFGSARAALLDIGQNLEGTNLLTGLTSGLGTAAADTLKAIADGDVQTLQAQVDAETASNGGRVDAFQSALDLARRDPSDAVRSQIIRVVGHARDLETEGQRRRGQMLVLQQIAREAIKPKSAMDSLRQAKMSLFSDVDFNNMSVEERTRVIQERMSDPGAAADVFAIVRGQARVRGLETLNTLITGKNFLDEAGGAIKHVVDGEGGRTWGDVYEAVRDMLRSYREDEVKTLSGRLKNASDDEHQKLMSDVFISSATNMKLTDAEKDYISRAQTETKGYEEMTAGEKRNWELEKRMHLLSERQIAAESVELVNLALASQSYYSDRSAYANALSADDSGFVNKARFAETSTRLNTTQKHGVIASVFMRGQFKSADGIQLALTDLFEAYHSTYETLVADGKTADEARNEVIRQVRREATGASLTDAYADFTVDAFTKYLNSGRDIVSSLQKAQQMGLEVAQQNGFKLVKDLDNGLNAVQEWHLNTLSKTEAELNQLPQAEKDEYFRKGQEVVDAFTEAKKALHDIVTSRVTLQQQDGILSAEDIAKAQGAVDNLVTKYGLDEVGLTQALEAATVKSVTAAEGAALTSAPKKPGPVTDNDAGARKFVAARAQLAEVGSIISNFRLHEPPQAPPVARKADHSIRGVEGVLSSFLERSGKSSFLTTVIGSFVPSAVEKMVDKGLNGYTDSWWSKAGMVTADGLAGIVLGADPRNAVRQALQDRDDPERWMNAAIATGSQFAGMGAAQVASDIAARAMVKKSVLAVEKAHASGASPEIQVATEQLKRTEFKARAGAALAGNAAAALVTAGAAWVGQALAQKLGFAGPRGQFREQLNYAMSGDRSSEVADEFENADLDIGDGDVDDEGVVVIRDENGNVIEQSFYRASWAARGETDESNMGILEAGLDTHVSEAGYDTNSVAIAGF